MKKIEEVINKYVINRTFSEGRKENEIKITEKYLNDDIKQIMKEYALEVLDEARMKIAEREWVTNTVSETINDLKQKIELE